MLPLKVALVRFQKITNYIVVSPLQTLTLNSLLQDSSSEDTKLKVIAAPMVSISLSALTSATSSTTTTSAFTSARVKEEPATRADSSSSPSSGVASAEDRLHVTENGMTWLGSYYLLWRRFAVKVVQWNHTCFGNQWVPKFMALNCGYCLRVGRASTQGNGSQMGWLLVPNICPLACKTLLKPILSK